MIEIIITVASILFVIASLLGYDTLSIRKKIKKVKARQKELLAKKEIELKELREMLKSINI